MTHEIIIAGFGGQGVLSMGKTLAYTGAMNGKEVTWLPSYGPEQRGGTSNVTVIISDNKISSPIIDKYDIVIALNQQSLSRFEKTVKPGGKLIYEAYGITTQPTRTDIKVYPINAMQKAFEIGLQKMYNSIVLGALLSIEPIATIEDVMLSLKKTLPERYHKTLISNRQAIKEGMNITIFT